MNQVVASPVDSSPRKKLKQPKLAYMVRESIEGHCVVVFAKSELQAKRLGATELDTTVDYIESAERCPEFDLYAEAGLVPPLVALEHNWWFECSHCGSRVTKNMEDDVSTEVMMKQALELLGYANAGELHHQSNLIHAIALFAGASGDADLEAECVREIQRIRAEIAAKKSGSPFFYAGNSYLGVVVYPKF